MKYMKKVMKDIMALGIILFMGLFFSNTASAATAYLTADYTNISVGDTILVSVALNTEEKNPNTVDGNVLLKNNGGVFEIVDFNLADSVFTNWLKTPSFENESRISFAGGIPGGFNKKDALLFQMVLLARTPGQAVFTPSDIQAFDNDGKATILNVAGTPLAITVGPEGSGSVKNQWQDVISTDNDPPQNLSVEIGQDESVFNGKKFMVISASDSQSGIDYFEVAEGNQPAFRTGSTYVLFDQSESTSLLVTVYDKAGNKKSILLHPDNSRKYRWWIFGGVVLLIGGYVFRKRFSFQKKFPFIQKKNA